MKTFIYFLVMSLCTLTATQAMTIGELKQVVCQELPTIEGWCSKEKALNFIDLVLQTKPDVCVEIGIFGGASVFPVAATLQYLGKGVIVGIDPWDKIECIKYFDPIEDREHLEWWGKVNLQRIKETYFNLIAKHGFEEICVTLPTTSEKAATEIGIIDILYIDGNHSEITSTQDVMLYLPKVRKGGYIWMDDALWPTTQHAIDLVLEACDVIKLIDDGNCILFRKR